MSRSSLPPLEDDFTRALLRSAEGDEPSPAAYGKVASALGVGVALGASASVPPAALAAAATGLAGAARWSSSALARLLAAGVSGAVLVGGGALLLRSGTGTQGTAARAALVGAAPTSVRPALPAAEPPVAAPAAPFAALATPQAAEPEPAEVLDLDSLEPSPGARGAHRVARAHVSAPSSSLAEEVQSLDRARVALGSGNASGALQEIAHYRKAWPRGVFLTEASVLEIEALAARGERALAARLASAFVSAHADSPQAGRLRALIPVEKR